MLRTMGFTITAANAVSSAPTALGIDFIVHTWKIDFTKHSLLIVNGKQIGNKNFFWTVFQTISATSTGNGTEAVQQIGYLCNGCLFHIGKWTEICHGLHVVFQLRHIAHSTEHHHDAFLGSCKSHGERCRACSFIQRTKQCFCFFR